MKLGASPQTPGIYRVYCLPVVVLFFAGAAGSSRHPGSTVQAPQSALGLHPCIALSSAAVSSTLAQ
jgi:hypothetical protein